MIGMTGAREKHHKKNAARSVTGSVLLIFDVQH